MAVLFTRCFVAWQLCLSTKPIEIQSTSGNLNELPITRTRTLFYFPWRFELSGVECMTKAHESEITLRLASLIGFTFEVANWLPGNPKCTLASIWMTWRRTPTERVRNTAKSLSHFTYLVGVTRDANFDKIVNSLREEYIFLLLNTAVEAGNTLLFCPAARAPRRACSQASTKTLILMM